MQVSYNPLTIFLHNGSAGPSGGRGDWGAGAPHPNEEDVSVLKKFFRELYVW